jgi:hypothetical protein
MFGNWFNSSNQSDVLLHSSVQDLKSEIRRQVVISRSKGFNLQMLTVTAIPALYFWLMESNFEFSSPIMSSNFGWLLVFGLVPIFYSLSLAIDNIHSYLSFRLLCRGLPLLGVGIWKLLFATMFWTDYVLQSPLLTIKRYWNFDQKLTYTNKYLSLHDSGSLVSEQVRKAIADNSSSLQQIEAQINQAIDRAMNPTWLEQASSFATQNGWQVICFVGIVVLGWWSIRSLSSHLMSQRSIDLNRIQALENQLHAVMDKTRDVSLQLMAVENGSIYNQQMVAARLASFAVRQSTTSNDVANLGTSAII